MPARKSTPSRLTAARKAESTAKAKYSKAKQRASSCAKDLRKAEVNLANKQLARIRIQH